ncbi:radical SAM protein [Endothiovibrio diazotrophicus]
MSDKFRIDGHKMMYHPREVARFLDAGDDWERAREIAPIYVELSPVGACNHRCTFCAYDYIGYEPVTMDDEALVTLMREMGEQGVKSVHLAGEGEPLLHKKIVEAINAGAEAGLDFGITTNGTVVNSRFVDEALDKVTWMKVSINAGSAETYQAIHRSKEGDFDKVIGNLRHAVEVRRSRGFATTIGAQAILLPENADELERLAQLCRDEIGLDYLVIKPYSQHLASNTHRYENIDYDDYLHLEEVLAPYSTDDFQVVFRANTMRKYGQAIAQRYTTCYSTPLFWAHIMTNGELFSCPAYLKDERFALGNVFEAGFKSVWQGERRRRNFEYVRRDLDISECRRNCRMDEVNRYLFDLKEGRVPHVNFI